jgi:hypothetical protein
MLGSLKSKHAKFELEIPYIWGYEKITKSNIYSSEQCKLSISQNISDFTFLWSIEYKLFRDWTLHVC